MSNVQESLHQILPFNNQVEVPPVLSFPPVSFACLSVAFWKKKIECSVC